MVKNKENKENLISHKFVYPLLGKKQDLKINIPTKKQINKSNSQESKDNHNNNEIFEKLLKLKQEKMKQKNFEKIILEKFNKIENDNKINKIIKAHLLKKENNENLIKLINEKNEQLKKENQNVFKTIIKKYFKEIHNDNSLKIQI